MICYSTKNKKQIGIIIKTSKNIERLNELLTDSSFIYHIWNTQNYNLLFRNLSQNEYKENNIYIHIKSINEISTSNIDKINDCGIIISLDYSKELTKYKCILPKIQRLHINISTDSLKSSIDCLNEIANYYYMINKYYFAFDINVNKFINTDEDVEYFVNLLMRNKNENHIIKNYFFYFLDKLNVIENDIYIPSYKNIGYVITNKDIKIYKDNEVYDNTLLIEVYNSIYTPNDICNNCNGFLFCSKIEELPYCLCNNLVYKSFYTHLTEAIINNRIVL